MKRCFRCKTAGRYVDKGGVGEDTRGASPHRQGNMGESPAEAVVAMMGDPGDDAVETTSF